MVKQSHKGKCRPIFCSFCICCLTDLELLWLPWLLFHFLSIQGYGCKNPGGPFIMIFFQEFPSHGIFFQGINLHSHLFQGGRLKFFIRCHFFRGIESSKIQFQGIYMSNSHSFQDVLVFKNLVVHTPVWRKNGIAQ